MLFSIPLSTSLSPNVTRADLWFALNQVLLPWQWQRWQAGPSVAQLERQFETTFDAQTAVSFDLGRSALQVILESLKLNAGDEVALQAFTCIVVPNSILAAGGKPIYIDIDSTYNMDPEQLWRKLQHPHKIKAVIVQHTFGMPADIERLQTICRHQNILLIEDCAHALGSRINGKLCGTFGDAAIFSFGRDKVISTVSGGMAVSNHPVISDYLKKRWQNLRAPERSVIRKQLQHPLIFAVALPLYATASIGKIMIQLAKTLRLFPWVLSSGEKRGVSPLPHRLPNVLAAWALRQLELLPSFTTHRRMLVEYYDKALGAVPEIIRPVTLLPGAEPNWFRYTIEIPNQSEAVLSQLKKQGILLGDWYRTVLAPADADASSVFYQAGSCPIAEAATKRVLNLPTSINTSLNDARRIIEALKQALSSYAND